MWHLPHGELSWETWNMRFDKTNLKIWLGSAAIAAKLEEGLESHS